MSVLQGIRPFDKSLLSSDVVAGITLAALAIPEVMGYTKIAGTPVITGLYTILLPAVAFAILGSSRHLVVGGDSATAAIMYAGIAGLGISGLQPGTTEWLAFASLSALITGGLLILARVARLGFLADFISRTVLVASSPASGSRWRSDSSRACSACLLRCQPRPTQWHRDQVLGHAEGDPRHVDGHAGRLGGGDHDPDRVRE